jgi:uncharacterized protein (TIGR03067 family)
MARILYLSWIVVCATTFQHLCYDHQRAAGAPKLNGQWLVSAHEVNGKRVEYKESEKRVVEITDNKMILNTGTEREEYDYTLDVKKSPAVITMIQKKSGISLTGILVVEEEQLKMCFTAVGNEAPKEFRTKAGDLNVLWLLKRMKE